MPSFVETPVDEPVARRLLDDYFESRELGFTTHPGGYRVVHPDPSWFTRPQGVFYLMNDDAGEPVGCGGIRRIADREELTTYEVKHVWLEPPARGRGWSRLLMERLESEAVALGARWLVLDTNESLTAAQHLYRSSGYEEIPRYNENPNATHFFGKRVG